MIRGPEDRMIIEIRSLGGFGGITAATSRRIDTDAVAPLQPGRDALAQCRLAGGGGVAGQAAQVGG